MIECAVTGEVDAERVSRPAIAKMLAHSPALSVSMAAIRSVDGSGTTFSPDTDQVRRIVTKIARAHAAYELHDFETLGSGGFAI